jgi:hypothetical protein
MIFPMAYLLRNGMVGMGSDIIYGNGRGEEA